MSDFDKASELFQVIGKMVHTNLTGDWKSVSVVFDLTSDPAGQLLVNKDSEVTNFSEEVTKSLSVHFRTLRDLTKKEGQDPWKKANLSITVEGKFDINFEY